MSLSLPPRAVVRTISRWQDTNEVVLALEVDGVTHRFTLDDAGLRFLAEELPVQRWMRQMRVVSVHCDHHALGLKVQSDSSSGSPSFDGSPKDGHAQVPLAAASAAEAGE
jgi:hypothetical protein